MSKLKKTITDLQLQFDAYNNTKQKLYLLIEEINSKQLKEFKHIKNEINEVNFMLDRLKILYAEEVLNNGKIE